MKASLLTQPGVAEDYWIAHPAAEVRVPASFHLGYGSQLPALEAAIRALHAKVPKQGLKALHVDDCAVSQPLHCASAVSGVILTSLMHIC